MLAAATQESYILLRNLGTAGRMVGRRAFRSDSANLMLPLEKPTAPPAMNTASSQQRSSVCASGR